MNDAWPVAILDFEASASTLFSYPIEVGFARWHGIDQPIESWGSLIRPEIDWVQDGCWSKDAEALHGITQGELWLGLSPSDICARLNAELAGCLVCSHLQRQLEAPAHKACSRSGHMIPYDPVWLSLLYEAGSTKPAFQLEPMDGLFQRGNPRMALWLDVNEDLPNRARERAVWQMRAFANGLRRRPERVELS